MQRSVLEDDGKEISEDDSWGDELEKELEGGEVAVRLTLDFRCCSSFCSLDIPQNHSQGSVSLCIFQVTVKPMIYF